MTEDSGILEELHDSEDDCTEATNILFIRDQTTFYDKVSVNGNSKMSNGNEVVLGEACWTCGKCDSQHTMYFLDDFFGSIRCEQDHLGCVLDAESSRRVVEVRGTVGQVLKIRGICFHRGQSNVGAGLYLRGTCILELCGFTSCRVSVMGGAIEANSGSLQVYATLFSSNSADSGNGDDIYTQTASVIVHDTCPDGYGGVPTAGENCLQLY